MTISIWRYSHFALAFVSSLFLLVASVTGVILAVEPISHATKGYAVADLDKISLATAITGLKENYTEIFSLEVETSGFVKASVLTEDFETANVYINPKTGKKLGKVAERPEIYNFATNLHRSLFLKSLGRFFVGIASLLLFLIAVTGIFLLAKRQGGLKKFFSKVQKEYFEMRYHVVLSRWFFIPIIILALTGVYLSAEKFGLLPDASIKFQDMPSVSEGVIYENSAEIPFFKQTPLSEVRKIEFPFSNDPEEYFRIALKKREIKLNQQTGTIVGSAPYPFVTFASHLSLILHTGQGSVLWSIILLFASASVVFFMYSGFVMTLKRLKKEVVKTPISNKNEAEIVLLVGSETATTFSFATRLYNALTLSGKKVLLTELNTYEIYATAKDVIVLTSTYGEGEPPTNARKFEALFSTVKQPNPINYSVVGFGSLEYPNYCGFAIEVDLLLQSNKNFHPVLPLYKINNSDFTDFEKWAKKWSAQREVSLKIEPIKQKKKLKLTSFEVIERTELNIDQTFLLRLKPKRNTKFSSGDLLSIFPNSASTARQYSIAKMGDEILLGIKKHEFGLGSSYLFKLKKGDSVKAAVVENPHFHFPKKTNSAILIANGTGIMPFLGMIAKNKNASIQLLWGGRFKDSETIYNGILESELLINPQLSIHKCTSREQDANYVQDLVVQQTDAIIKSITAGGTIMICGSLSMQHGVLDVLENILRKKSNVTLDILHQNGQLKMDCY